MIVSLIFGILESLVNYIHSFSFSFSLFHFILSFNLFILLQFISFIFKLIYLFFSYFLLICLLVIYHFWKFVYLL